MKEQPQGGPGAQGIDRWMPLALVLLFLLALAGGAALLLRQGDGGGVEVTLPDVILKAHADGAVNNPGVYAFSDGDRLVDLLRMAGGPTQDADTSRLNMALRLHDEQQYYIPKVGETPPVPLPQPGVSPPVMAQGGGAVDSGAGDGKLDLNTATAEQLQTLPGVGSVRAEAIVAHRERDGQFVRVEDLLLVRGIGQGTLDAVRDQITVRPLAQQP